MRAAPYVVLSLFLACGGKAVIDPGAADGGGGTSGDSSSGSTNPSSGSGSPDTSSSSGMPQRCDNIFDCCEQLCDAATDLACFDEDRECECGAMGGVPGCRQSIRALFQCMVSELPSSLGCADGDVAITCGACEDEIASVPPECGFDVGPCAP